MNKYFKKATPKTIVLSVIRQVLMICISLMSLFPIYFMLITAFKTKEEYAINKLMLPMKIAWSNFSDVLVDENFGNWFLNSLILTLGASLLSMIVSIFASYGLAIFRTKFSDFISNFIISLFVIPPVVMIIPLFIFLVKIKMINNLFSVILIYTGLTLPFSINLLLNFFKVIPQSIIEAGYIDGASNFLILKKIIIPLSKPPIITLLVVNGLWVWNELFIALILLQKNNLKTLMVGLTVFKSQYDLNVPLTMVGLLIATLPIIIAYFIGQKYFQEGLTMGAIK